jgi:hypothetical protein
MRTQAQPPVGTSLYGACEKLFADYPLAVEPVTTDGTQARMGLMLRVGDEETFWTLHQVTDGEPHPLFVVSPWRDPDQAVAVDSVGGAEEQGGLRLREAEHVVTDGVPLPRDGSMFGWKGDGGGTIGALILSYADPERDEEAVFSILPLAGIPESRWPPFTGESLFGPWFWEHLRAGRTVDLAALIGETRRMAFWVKPRIPGTGDGVVAVKADLDAEGGFTLPKGRYVYWKALRALAPVPSLSELLASPDRTDLGPRFERR